MSSIQCPYCGATMNPLSLTNISASGVGITFSRPTRLGIPYYCGVCHRLFWIEKPDLNYLLNHMEFNESILRYLNTKFGITRYKDFLNNNYVAFTKRLAFASKYASLKAEDPTSIINQFINFIKKRQIFSYDYIFEYKRTKKRYYITCYYEKKLDKYVCPGPEPIEV
ncbi:hypothetical protein [Sulfurisphaera javensis]|uniref:hypothetical protein n=1 Tax=Sulfurisphaera javensis TaxID=2049879 RepID=UPI0034E8B61C